jgi:hypothetical protein
MNSSTTQSSVWSRKRARSAQLIKFGGVISSGPLWAESMQDRINELADVVLTLVLVCCHDDESARHSRYPGPCGRDLLEQPHRLPGPGAFAERLDDLGGEPSDRMQRKGQDTSTVTRHCPAPASSATH